MVENNNMGLETAVESLLTSYAERNTDIEFSAWLAERLQQEMPNLTAEAGQNLSNEIIRAVTEYDKTLDELNKAVESGQSKEEWLSDRMEVIYADKPIEETGEILSEIENGLNVSNALLMDGTADSPIEAEVVDADFEEVGWNEYSIKQKFVDVGQQAAMVGLSASADIIKANIENAESLNTDGIISTIGQALQVGMETSRSEVKAVVSGAVKSAVENKATDILPANTPIETICDISCAAVEGAGALFDAATGKCTLTKALDKVGRACVATVCQTAAKIGKAALSVAAFALPVIGPIVSKIGTALLTKIETPKFTEETYTVVKSVAKPVWNGIKKVGNALGRGIMSIGRGAKNFFKKKAEV